MGLTGIEVYGEPCGKCGFSWKISMDDAQKILLGLPTSFGELLAGATGKESLADTQWSVGEYVCHVGDNLRIWSERIAGITRSGTSDVGTYDQDLLAKARNYDQILLAAALWSLGKAVNDWRQIFEHARQSNVHLVHPDFGTMTLTDVVRTVAHDAAHHSWDIAGAIAQSRR